MRNTWHFYYALIYVFKVLCGGFVLRCSLLSLALVCKGQKSVCGLRALFYVLAIHLFVFQSHELSGGTMSEVFA
ncbi:DUF3265 domain-containing protein, partial [Vibrio toranzoniae]|nr:DUF3265 domain-containing protein [Vibrio toranzoniae]